MQLSKQTGITFWGFIFAIALALAILVLSVRLLPVYLENMSVQQTLDQLADNETVLDSRSYTSAVSEMKRVIRNNFEVKYVNRKLLSDIKYDLIDDGILVFINYEVRKKIVGNVDIVVSFYNEVLVPWHR